MAFTESLSPFFADFGVPVVADFVTTVGILNQAMKAEEFGSQHSTFIAGDPVVTIQRDALPLVKVGTVITVAGLPYKVRSRNASADGALHHLLLQDVPL